MMATTLDQTDSLSLRAVARLGHHALRGEFLLSEEVFKRSSALYDRSQHASHVGLTGADFGVLELAWSSHSLWALGHAEEAEARVQEALALARTLMHPFSEALALAYSAMLDQMDGHYDRAAERAGSAQRCRAPPASSTTRPGKHPVGLDAARRQPSAATVSSLRAAIDASSRPRQGAPATLGCSPTPTRERAIRRLRWHVWTRRCGPDRETAGGMPSCNARGRSPCGSREQRCRARRL
jgi:hypothetical protein